jgi:tetratricopeptide (TPR) repeat protein
VNLLHQPSILHHAHPYSFFSGTTSTTATTKTRSYRLLPLQTHLNSGRWNRTCEFPGVLRQRLIHSGPVDAHPLFRRDARAQSRRERRAGADKLQAEGNAAFKQGELKKALHLYSDGIDMCKDHKQLRTNRALVCNKLGRYPEAIEDCTKVLDICELFEGNSGPGVKEARLKALSRRATAYKASFAQGAPSTRLRNSSITSPFPTFFHEHLFSKFRAWASLQKLLLTLNSRFLLNPATRRFRPN